MSERRAATAKVPTKATTQREREGGGGVRVGSREGEKGDIDCRQLALPRRARFFYSRSHVAADKLDMRRITDLTAPMFPISVAKISATTFLSS